MYDDDYYQGGGYQFTLTLNPPPAVSITAPADGESVVAGATVPVSATATDNGTVASVTFMVDGVEQAAFTAAPYSFNFLVPSGITSFVLDVTAVDNYGASATASRTVPVIVDPLTTLTGVVKDPGGLPVSGASIYITRAGLTGTTAIDGSFNVPGVSTILGELMARASALVNGRTVYARSPAVIPVPAGITSVGTIILKPLPFYSGEKFAVPGGQTAMVEADMNLDGIPDVATVNSSGDLVFHIGYGEGRLEAQRAVTVTGSGARKIAVADLNNDTRPDVAISQQGSGNVAVFLAKADGSFAAQQDFAVGTAPGAIVSADLNNDGLADILTANETSNDLSFLTGFGDGTFAAEQRLAVGLQPVQLAVARLNADAAFDIVTANEGSNDLSVLIGAGGGGFTPEIRVTTAAGLMDMGVADMNNDAIADIVSVGSLPLSAGGEIDVLIGIGNGNFNSAIVTPVTADPAIFKLADINQDSRADVLLGHPGPSGEMTLLLNNGNGTFGPEQPLKITEADPSDILSTPFPVADILPADLNRDGSRDLVALVDQAFVAGQPEKTLQILMGQTPGLFVTAQIVAVGLQPISGSSADFNGDGFADVVTANEGSGDLSLILNNGGTFGPEVRLILGFTPAAVAAGEFSGDSLADVVVVSAAGSVLFAGNGDGTFQPAAPYAGTATENTFVDINADGIADQVSGNFAGNDVSVRMGSGDGTFKPEQRFAAGSGVRDVIVADVNNDGLQDIVSVDAAGSITILRHQ